MHLSRKYVRLIKTWWPPRKLSTSSAENTLISPDKIPYQGYVISLSREIWPIVRNDSQTHPSKLVSLRSNTYSKWRTSFPVSGPLGKFVLLLLIRPGLQSAARKFAQMNVNTWKIIHPTLFVNILQQIWKL